MKVLVIDDNSQFLNLINEILSDNYVVECFADFKTIKDIVDKIINFSPDVLLLDINLGGFSGIDVLREMRKSESLKKIPIIVITASDYNLPTEMLLKDEKNIVGFYSKLESIDVIKEKINNLKLKR